MFVACFDNDWTLPLLATSSEAPTSHKPKKKNPLWVWKKLAFGLREVEGAYKQMIFSSYINKCHVKINYHKPLKCAKLLFESYLWEAPTSYKPTNSSKPAKTHYRSEKVCCRLVRGWGCKTQNNYFLYKLISVMCLFSLL